MRWILVAFLALWPALASAGSVTLRWEASTGATGYEIEQSVDNGTTYTLVANLTTAVACPSVTTPCTTTLTAPSTGLVLFRFSAKNAIGKTIRFGEGVWHCESCKPPTQPANVGVQ